MRLALAMTVLVALMTAASCTLGIDYHPRPSLPINPAIASRFDVDQAESKASSERRPESGEPLVIAPVEGEGGIQTDEIVTLNRVLFSVDEYFPELIAARQEIEIAEGALLAANGAFDPKVKSKSKFKRGFYDQETLDVMVEQPTPFLGSRVFGGYRIGQGDFASYDEDLETNKAGELRLGAAMPILRGREIDGVRAELWRARIRRDAANPIIQLKRVATVRKASQAYWKWLAAGQNVQVARDLLKLAEDRQSKLRDGVASGQFADIILVDNQRLVVERKRMVIDATREFERIALVLSIYLRNSNGDPIRTSLANVPETWPKFPSIPKSELENHILFGLGHRPELQQLGFQRSEAVLDLALNQNQLLPVFDAEVFASQDIGESSSSKEVNDPFEFGVGVQLEIPLLRRKARGKLIQTRAKITKISQQARLAADQVEAQIRDAASALERSLERLVLARESVLLASQMEVAERDAMDLGASDLLRLNLREQSTAKARATLLKLEALCFSALANYRAAIGLPASQPSPSSRP